MRKAQLTQKLVRELLTYDASTGNLWWKERAEHWFNTKRSWAQWNARYAGKPAFTYRHGGRRWGCIMGRSHLAHRIAWLHCYGSLPEAVTFVDGNACNLRLVNLRDPRAKQRERLAA